MKQKFDPVDTLEQERKIYHRRIQTNLHNVSFLLGIGVLIYLLILYLIVFFVNGILPRDLRILDEDKNPESFIAERAIGDLKALTSIGPRVAGSDENEILAKDFLTRQINSIIGEANSNQQIELDIQTTKGAFLFIKSRINVYDVNNIVVKLHGQNGTNASVLLNLHYDSMPTSPGGCDDGINVVAMLEILRKLSKSSQRPLHNVIFLFNGAEETGLQAAHAFITQHRWAQECKVLINLEAAGHGGKIILFQTGPNAPWLLKYYASVPHPSGQVAGEEIFQSGLIPSDTDFRIFRDYGKLIGYDMAFSHNGYRYHTKYDDFENIPNGSYQHVGDNTLSLVRSLANAPEVLQNFSATSDNVIYFDVLGLFLISYTTLTANILNYVIIVVSVVLFLISLRNFKQKKSNITITYLIITTLIIISGWIISLAGILFIAWFLDILNSTMSWYANPWLLGGLYVVPTIGLSGVLLLFTNFKFFQGVPLNMRCQIQAHIVRLFWTLIFLIGTTLNIRSMYILMVPILFNCIAFLIIQIFRWQHTRRNWLFVYFGALLIPTLISMYQVLLFLLLFVPITGRNTPNSNPELLIGLLTGISTIIITSPYVALTPLMRNLKYYFIFLVAVFIVFLIIVFTPLGFPYNGNPKSAAPQRYFLTHSKRVFYNESGAMIRNDSGILLLNMDRNSPKKVESYVADIGKAESLTDDCNTYVLCGLPLSQTKMLQIMDYSSWIPCDDPDFPQPLNFEIISKSQISSSIVRYGVTVSGSDRLNIFLQPINDMVLVNVNFEEIKKKIEYSYSNTLLLIRYSSRQLSNLTFTFDIKVPNNYDGITTVVAVSAIYVHDKVNVKTAYFEDLIKQFPLWADVIPDLGYYAYYVI